MDKKVTIIIPTFNRAQYVTKTIDCALAQTVPCDIIVCDHGSSDNTPEVVSKYGDKITYIRRERDFGPHFCWLEAVLHANTEFVHLHFDDDLMENTFIEKTLELMHEDVGMVFTNAKFYYPQDDTYSKDMVFNLKRDFSNGIIDSSIVEKNIISGYMFSPAVCLYRKKDVIDAILPGDLPIDFGGNYHGVGPDILMQLLACIRYPKIGCVDEPLAYFGSHDGSITEMAWKDIEKKKKILAGYDAYRKYYNLIKLYKNNKGIQRKVSVEKLKPWNKRLERNIKLVLKAVGLRKKEVI